MLADEKKMMTIMQHTVSPRYIVFLAKEFIKYFFQEKPFIAVHWRYNRGDFLNE